MAQFAVENLTFAYPQAGKYALDQVSFGVEHGEFLLLCGPSGCGKTTLLRHLKTVLAPHGERSGLRLFEGRELDKVPRREQVSKIGYVLQNPENQIVTDKVWHELAFGLESLGYDSGTIRLRVAEMASFFGIGPWFHEDVSKLSGGQKQLLNLASVMAMQPELLILDEPTSQLDPIAAAEFLQTVKKINRELAVTILLTEHRLEEVFSMADRVLVMKEGRLMLDAPPREAGRRLKAESYGMYPSLPAPVQVYAGIARGDQPCPLTVREGREFLTKLFDKEPPAVTRLEADPKPAAAKPAIELKDLWFRYEKNGQDILKGLSLKVETGCFFAVVGGNGAGKTTLLSLIAGLQTPYRGKIRLEGTDARKIGRREQFDGRVRMLPQNPQALFVKKTAMLELTEMLEAGEKGEGAALAAAEEMELTHLLEQHPYDLSGGEQQRLALAKVLLLSPNILLLDEPTKGMEASFKEKLAERLLQLCQQGVTVLMVSHDIEFCAKYTHRCAMFFDGVIVSENSPRAFFSGNRFYTTAANRMSRHLFENAITSEEVIELCRKNGR